MDGIHDLGGKPGFSEIEIEVDEPVFHSRWEAKVFASVTAGIQAGAWNNTDKFRHAIERVDPEAYLAHGYYGRWLGAVETLLVEAGIMSTNEITDKAVSLGGDAQDLIAARPESSPEPLSKIERLDTASRPLEREPLFRVGDKVVASNEVKAGHTRLPAYARGKTGTVITWHQGWVFPDTNAHGKGEQPQHLYTVQFEGRVLWGSESEEKVCVSLDLFEPYLALA